MKSCIFFYYGRVILVPLKQVFFFLSCPVSAVSLTQAQGWGHISTF